MFQSRMCCFFFFLASSPITPSVIVSLPSAISMRLVSFVANTMLAKSPWGVFLDESEGFVKLCNCSILHGNDSVAVHDCGVCEPPL